MKWSGLIRQVEGEAKIVSDWFLPSLKPYRPAYLDPCQPLRGSLLGELAPLQPAAERPRILVVDDDPQMLRFVRDALNGAGYAPLVAVDQHELAHVLAIENPALVVLDLVLPGTDGIELVETVPALADLPVIFISRLRARRHHRTRSRGRCGGLHSQAILPVGAR